MLQRLTPMSFHSCNHQECAGRPFCARDAAQVAHILDDVLSLARSHSFRPAARRFGDLRLRLEQDMAAVEEGLFPALEQQGAVTEVRKLRETHYRMHRTLDLLGGALSAYQFEKVQEAVGELLLLIPAHREAEQRAVQLLTADVVADANGR